MGGRKKLVGNLLEKMIDEYYVEGFRAHVSSREMLAGEINETFVSLEIIFHGGIALYKKVDRSKMKVFFSLGGRNQKIVSNCPTNEFCLIRFVMRMTNPRCVVASLYPRRGGK